MGWQEEVRPLVEEARGGRVVLLTGAGISAESGIPTFRGKEGYWTVGSKEYHPEEMATLAAFRTMREEVWKWYLYRLGVCRDAEPNPAHAAVAALEQRLEDRFTLITQNVDGLHLRAGNSLERMCQVHGNIELFRCAGPCSTTSAPQKLHRMSAEFAPRAKDDPITDRDRELLACPDCGGRTRPHVLWFDEYYDEELYRSETALNAARKCSLLIIVGTAGATTLPVHAARVAVQSGAALVDINPDESTFSEMADRHPKGVAIKGGAGDVLPLLLEELE